MTTVHNSHRSSSDALLQSSPPEGREQLLSSSSGNTPLPPSSPVSAPPPASFPATDPAAEYGDDDIDDVLSDNNEPTSDISSRNRAISNLQIQDKEQNTRRLERMKKRSAGTTMVVRISLYDEPCTRSDSSYNHLDPSELWQV